MMRSGKVHLRIAYWMSSPQYLSLATGEYALSTSLFALEKKVNAAAFPKEQHKQKLATTFLVSNRLTFFFHLQVLGNGSVAFS